MTFPPLIIGIRNTQAISLRTRLTKDRKRVMERMFSKAFQELAFFMGLPDQTSRITNIHSTSIITVIAVSKSN